MRVGSERLDEPRDERLGALGLGPRGLAAAVADEDGQAREHLAVAGLAVVGGVQEFVAEDVERQHGIAHRRIDKHLVHALGRAAPGPALADAEVRAAAAGETAPELHVGRDDDAELRPLFGDFSGGLDEPCLALGNHNLFSP